MEDTLLGGFLADYPPLLTVKQVAAIFQVTPLTIKRWGKRGILPPIRINSRGDRRYTKEQVLWLLGQRQEKQTQPSVNKKLYEAETATPQQDPELEEQVNPDNRDTNGSQPEDLKPRHSF